MFPRFLLLLPALVAAIALPVAPALAGEDDDQDGGGGGGGGGTATLRASQGCVSGDRARATVTGDNIERVDFYVDGNLVDRVTRPNAPGGRFSFSMRCSRLSAGSHRASAVVSFEQGPRRALRFRITRAAQVSPRFTG